MREDWGRATHARASKDYVSPAGDGELSDVQARRS